jgi:hypothetical protein
MGILAGVLVNRAEKPLNDSDLQHTPMMAQYPLKQH